MKRSLLFFIAVVSVNYYVLSQGAQGDVVRYELKHNQEESQKITLTSMNDNFTTVDLALECRWDSITNQIQFVFNRSLEFQESSTILCFSMYSGNNTTLIKNMKKQNSTAKALWLGRERSYIKLLRYFMRSDDGKCDIASHYVALANGIIESFNFSMNNGKASEVSIEFKVYFLKQEKKRCSRRNMRIIGEAYDLNVKIELIRPVINVCEGSDEILNEIIEKIAQLESIREKDITQIKAKPNCTVNLKEKQTEVIQDFLEYYPAWDNYSQCEMIEDAINRYSDIRSAILNDTCIVVTRRPVTACSVDFKTINDSLMDLQIDILRKKRNGDNTENEKTEYLSIKNDTDKKLTANCPKDQVDSYNTFCRNIEKALNE